MAYDYNPMFLGVWIHFCRGYLRSKPVLMIVRQIGSKILNPRRLNHTGLPTFVQRPMPS